MQYRSGLTDGLLARTGLDLTPFSNPGPLTASGIYQIITRRGRQAGVVVHPHRFRHHFSHPWTGAARKAT